MAVVTLVFHFIHAHSLSYWCSVVTVL